MATVTIQDIKDDMRVNNESDAYYIDSINNTAYHVHELSNGKCVFMKNTRKQIIPIDIDEFLDAVSNKCYFTSIGADSYYSMIPSHSYEHKDGFTKEQVESLIKTSTATEYIKTDDGKYFLAKPRNITWPHEIKEPHLRKVTAVFPNGRKAYYCVNLNNGIATFIKFIDL